MNSHKIAEGMNCRDKLHKHDTAIEQFSHRLANLEYDTKQTSQFVNKEMINSAMMQTAMKGIAQEFELKMADHVAHLKTYVHRELSDLVTSEVSYIVSRFRK